MPERRRSRVAAIVAATALTLLVGPSSSAAPSEWVNSAFAAPFDDGKETMTTSSFPISGTFVKTNATPRVGSVSIRPNAAFQMVDATGQPTSPSEPLAQCPSSGSLAVNSGPPSEANDNGRAQRSFTITSERSTWPCNGRYAVTVTADSADPGKGNETYSMKAVATVAVRPIPIDVIDVDVDDENDEVTVTFEKLTAEELAPDALSYRVQRAGPADEDGKYGSYELLGEVPIDAEPTFLDEVEAFGDFRYRVASVRNGADGPIFAPIDGTAVAEATITPNPGVSTTTTTTRPRSTSSTTNVPRIGSGRPIPTIPSSPGRPLPAPPTSIDPGFDPELDYDGQPRLPSESPELAGEDGLSVIQNEAGDGPGLLAPVAGAMVLIGWAGHVVYLNRLAKQF